MIAIEASTEAIAKALAPLAAFGSNADQAKANILNRVAERVRAQVIPTLAEQTGLSTRIIAKAVRINYADAGNARAVVWSRGGSISYRYFGAREEAGGVTARVKGQTIKLTGGFRRSGRDPNRYFVEKLNRQVYVNVQGGKWHGKISKRRSGVFIPVEMVQGATRTAFYNVVQRELTAEVAREVSRLTGGR